MPSQTIAITGGTGFVGRNIAQRLADKGNTVIVFSRTPRPDTGTVRYAVWNPDKEEIDLEALRDVDTVINLAGAGVADKRWTKAYKDEIVRSRVDATLFLHHQIAEHAPRCHKFIAASATGYYGPDRKGHSPFREDAPPHTDFLADVCRRWEEATFSARSRYKQTVVFRIGIVMGRDGGAYPKLAGPMKFGIMPILGSGEQVVSWIHLDDLARMFVDAALSDTYDGVYNAVAPNPVTHLALMRSIAKAKGGLTIPAPVPSFMLNLIMGEASVEVLKSCTVSAEKILGEGFSFQYFKIDDAVKALAGQT